MSSIVFVRWPSLQPRAAKCPVATRLPRCVSSGGQVHVLTTTDVQLCRTCGKQRVCVHPVAAVIMLGLRKFNAQLIVRNDAGERIGHVREHNGAVIGSLWEEVPGPRALPCGILTVLDIAGALARAALCRHDRLSGDRAAQACRTPSDGCDGVGKSEG